MGCATVPPPKTFSNESENQQPHEDGKMPKCDKEMSESEAQPSSEVFSHSSIQESTAQREEPVKDSLEYNTNFDNGQNISEKSMEHNLSSKGNLDIVKKDAHVRKKPELGYEKYLVAEFEKQDPLLWSGAGTSKLIFKTIFDNGQNISEKSMEHNLSSKGNLDIVKKDAHVRKKPELGYEKYLVAESEKQDPLLWSGAGTSKLIVKVFQVTNMLAILRWLMEKFTKAKIPGGGNCNFTKVDPKKKKRYLTKKVKQALTVASRAILVGLLISHHGQVEAGSSSKSTQLTCAEPEGTFLSQINGIRICVRPGLLGKDVRRNALLHMRSGGSSKQIPIEISEGTLHISPKVSRRRGRMYMKLELTQNLDTYTFSPDCHRDDVSADPCMRFEGFRLCFRQKCFEDDKHKLVRLVVSRVYTQQACLRVCQKSQG